MKKLSREEMKKIMGGKLDPIICFVTYEPGYSGAYYLCENSTQSQCQTAASTWCQNTEGCSSTSC
jgi:hypothetical protein